MDPCSRIWISKFQFQNFGSLTHMGLVLSSVQNFKPIWLWTIFVTNCFKFLVIWMMACYFPFWCLCLIVMFAFWQKKNIKKYFLVCCIRPIPLHVLEHFLCTKILEVLKMCFRMDFLNTKKIVFLHFWILQHVCKTPKGIGQYSKKYKNLILGGIHLLFTANVWIKKSLKDEYPKYYWE